jgi:hypothetical protein
VVCNIPTYSKNYVTRDNSTLWYVLPPEALSEGTEEWDYTIQKNQNGFESEFNLDYAKETFYEQLCNHAEWAVVD